MRKNNVKCEKLNRAHNLCAPVNIGLDLDGVIIDHTWNKIKIAKLLGFKIKPKETSSPILKKILPEKTYRKLQNEIYGRITMKAPPVTGALYGIQKLSREGHNLHIISRRKTPRIALAWLKRYKVLKYIPSKSVFFVEEERDKNTVAEKLKIKIYLDDKTSVLEHISCVPYLIFFNFHRVPINEKFLEISSWREFIKLLKTIKKGA